MAATDTLHRAARRIFAAGRQEDWRSAVLDAASAFCGEGGAVLLTVQGARLRREHAGAPQEISPSSAPAIAQALESAEPVVSAWSATQLSAEVLAWFPEPRSGRALLFPVTGAGRSCGLVIGSEPAAGAVDMAALELVCLIAGAAWQVRRAQQAPAGNGLIALGPRKEPPPPDLSERARRFASVRVAQLRLYKAAQVSEGRARNSLYDLFQAEIDHDREIFRTRFLEKHPAMTDYLHEELVRTLAQGEADRMGESYPGAMSSH